MSNPIIYSVQLGFINTVIGMTETKTFRFLKESQALDFIERATTSTEVNLFGGAVKRELASYENVDDAIADLIIATKRGIK